MPKAKKIPETVAPIKKVTKPKKIVRAGVAPEFEDEKPTRKDSPSILPQPSTPVTKVSPTPSQLIWEKIQSRPIQMFGLPNQFVGAHVTVYDIDPNILCLKVKSTAVIPQLEAALLPDFDMTVGDRYIEVFPAKGKKSMSLTFQGV